jgi:hypothetical protein
VPSLRSAGVKVGDTHVTIADGARLALCWREVKGAFAKGGGRGTAMSLLAYCPTCGATARSLLRPAGEAAWRCCSCTAVTYRCQRRPGNSKGKNKPLSYEMARLTAQQDRIACMLALRAWPPRKLMWSAAELEPTRKLQPERMAALLARLDAVEALRLLVLQRQLSILGASVTEPIVSPEQEAALHRLMAATKWALRDGWRRRPAAV